MVTVPYVHSVTEKIQRIFTKHGVATVVKPQTTLRQVLVHPMDKVDKQNMLEWCTKFHATNAKRYTSVKPGDSWETGSQNTERKQKGSLTEISQDPSAKLLPMSTTKSAITDHVCHYNHIMNWEGSEIVEQESDTFKRSIKESILCVRSNTPTMNRDEGAYQLSPMWKQVISTPN